MQSREGEIEFCGIDIDLMDVEKGVPFICNFLTKLGAPKGSKLSYEHKRKSHEIAFGKIEGLALYLNGTELPKEVYKNSDINEVYGKLNRLLKKRGHIQGHWQGPAETALYMYGPSADEMRKLIAGYVAKHPLCQRSRLIQIA